MKFDVSSISIFVSKTLQETSLGMPKLMTVCRKFIRTFDELRNIVERNDRDAFYCDDISPATNESSSNLLVKEKTLFLYFKQGLMLVQTSTTITTNFIATI